jgi:glycosyltransferase involved in cell wall biosynthesis
MLKVNIVGRFFDNHSLSIINRNIALGLSDRVDLRLIALDSPNPAYKVAIDKLTKLTNLRGEHSDPDVEIRHVYPPVWRYPVSKNTKLVYVQPWEFMAAPSEWQYKFETFSDCLVSLSKFSEEAFLNGGLNPEDSTVIPCGFDPAIFNTEGRVSSTTTRVLFVGCSQFRKGLDLLLGYWAKNTNKRQDLELVIKDTPQIYGQSNLLQEITTLQYKTRCAKIVYDDSIKSEIEMANLYKNSDILVHPYRGEGFGMHVQEAMACGVIPVVTGGGSTDDFVNEYRVPATRRVVNMNEIFALKPGDSMSLMGHHRHVLEPDTNQLTAIINNVISNYKNISVDTSKLHTWDAVSDQYFNLINKMAAIKEPKRVRR